MFSILLETSAVLGSVVVLQGRQGEGGNLINEMMHNSMLQGQCRKTVSSPDKLICLRFMTVSRPFVSLSVQSQVEM